jgi:acyl-CoA synthetase (AMP-forming)/AMP-acid ligase II
MTVHAPYRYDASAFRAVFERQFTYLAGVERNSHRYAGRPALSDPATGRRWTYAELWDDAGRVAVALQANGVQAGDAVVLSLFNGGEFVLVWLAAQRLGAIAAPINFRLSSGEVAYVLDDSQPTAFVYDQTLARTAADALTLAEHQPRLLVAVGEDTAPATSFDELLASGDPGADLRPPADATVYDESTRLYTSGTTGMPKGVSLNSLVDVLSAHDVIMHFPLSPEDRTLNMTPWFHRGGLYSGGPNPVLYVGAESANRRPHQPGDADRRAERASP